MVQIIHLKNFKVIMTTDDEHVSLQAYTRIMQGLDALPHLPGQCNECTELFFAQKEALCTLRPDDEYSPLDYIGDYEDREFFRKNKSKGIYGSSEIIKRVNTVQRKLYAITQQTAPNAVGATINGSLLGRTGEVSMQDFEFVIARREA